MPSKCCRCDLDTVPGVFFFPEVLGHQQIVRYQIPPFWLILEPSICNHFRFPTPCRADISATFLSLSTLSRSRSVSHDGCVTGLCFSSDGLDLFSLGRDGRMRKWCASTGRNRKARCIKEANKLQVNVGKENI